MINDSVITKDLVREVGDVILPPNNTPERLLSKIEPKAVEEIQDLCEAATGMMLDMRNRRSENLVIDEIVNFVGPKFFMIGFTIAMAARDAADGIEVKDIEKLCKQFVSLSESTKDSTKNKLKDIISKQRNKSSNGDS